MGGSKSKNPKSKKKKERKKKRTRKNDENLFSKKAEGLFGQTDNKPVYVTPLNLWLIKATGPRYLYLKDYDYYSVAKAHTTIENKMYFKKETTVV